MVAAVDQDKSGQIEFSEFLRIIKHSDSDDSKMTMFFRDLCNGKYGVQKVSFPIFVNKMKRSYLMDAIRSTDMRKK